MRYSTLFAPSLKEPPKDAVLKSHQFLIQAGFIKQIGSGIYSFLPLGQKVLSKIKNIIKEEMDKHGAQECMFNFITPASLWEQSKRLHKYGQELLVFKDRKNYPFVLGPTHEEVAVEVVKGFVQSYKQLPLHLYQIHTKFRDEIRPRFGLMRAREFIMKDGYSFHVSTQDLEREFNAMEQVYSRIFTRLGLNFRAVQADSGAIGGNKSKEFVVLAECGEDSIIACTNCSYAANIEIARRARRCEPDNVPKASFAKFSTPNTPTIEALSAFFKVDPFFIIKAIAKQVLFEDRTTQIVFFFLRGDDFLEETKALNAINRLCTGRALSLEELSAETLEQIGMFPGYMGPYGLKHILPDALVIFDCDLEEANSLICGANEKEMHFVGVDLATFEGLNYQDIAAVRVQDLCPECQGNLEQHKSIEVGHIFQLGNTYAKNLEASFLNTEGEATFFEMGCYGIGVSRLLPAILEQKSDSKGCVWSLESAPFEVVLVVANSKDTELVALAQTLYQELLEAGVDVLLDDRNLRFGAKMIDFERIGSSYALIIGKEAKSGHLELIKREGLSKQIVERVQLIDILKAR
ncbi:proline--tRNA ligase [Helicobacter suis]|uniref:Proline--tRNA ligase n=1 Tax=Helicobacter suis TaxID=104628 RepID=A0A6J4CWY4_9HELI|nr:proline--tRNA ligase [Helicobacter suis]BCD69861.1 Prolyl-tRNA synthetase ProS [Helicobacter suis]